MITAKEATMKSLESDHNFQEVLNKIRNAARQGLYNTSYTLLIDPVTQTRFLEGLTQLGYEASFKNEYNNGQLFVAWGNK